MERLVDHLVRSATDVEVGVGDAGVRGAVDGALAAFPATGTVIRLGDPPTQPA